MLKSAFNKAVEWGENVYYGVMLDSMGPQRKLRLNLWGGVGVAVGTCGLLAGDGEAVAIAAGVVAGTALAFGEAGARVHHAAATPRPEL